jgi:hypothetical protein
MSFTEWASALAAICCKDLLVFLHDHVFQSAAAALRRLTSKPMTQTQICSAGDLRNCHYRLPQISESSGNTCQFPLTEVSLEAACPLDAWSLKHTGDGHSVRSSQAWLAKPLAEEGKDLDSLFESLGLITSESAPDDSVQVRARGQQPQPEALLAMGRDGVDSPCSFKCIREGESVALPIINSATPTPPQPADDLDRFMEQCLAELSDSR